MTSYNDVDAVYFCLANNGINFIIIAMKPNKPRKKINNYLIHFDRPLGAGASGQVFLCLEEARQVWMAVKIIEKSQCTSKAIQSITILIWQKPSNKNYLSTAVSNTIISCKLSM